MRALVMQLFRFRSRAPRAPRRLRVGVCTVLASAGLSALVLGATALPAAAAPTTATKATTLSGTSTLSAAGVHFTGAGIVSGHVTFRENLKWTQPAQLSTTYNPNTVRQGQSPAPTVVYSTTSAGSMTVTWSVHWYVTVATLATFTGTVTLTATGPCTLKASGPKYECSPRSSQATLITILIGHLRVSLGATVTITPKALTTNRKAVLGGVTVGTKTLSVTETPTTDFLTVPCTAPAGTSLTYTLTGLSVSDPLHVANKLFFTITVFDIGSTPTVTLGTQTSSITMSGAGGTFSFGNVLANNVPPVARAGGPYSGNEGSPIHFTGSGSSSFCGAPTLIWQFSDGGVAYGTHPQHTFEGPGTYSGLLTAVDSSGLSNMTTFTVTVYDLPPVAHAGPPVTTQWGVPVTLSGSAVDPGTAQQALLTYSWTFGDGTGGIGGTTAAHVYENPGTYRPTFTACDPELLCGESTTLVTVTKRATTLSYTGSTSGSVTDATTFQASLVDDTGQAVVGGTVQFFADGSAVPFASASTNTFGIASVQYAFPLGSVGTHTVVAKFAGTSKYTASHSSSTTFTVSKEGTVLTYTGTKSVKKAHTAAVSATLTDDAGRPLAGKFVVFTLATQSCVGVTNVSGVASCTIFKVAAKTGSYTLFVAFGGTINYTPSGVGVGFEVD